MSGYSELKSILNRSSYKMFRRLYFRKRLSGGTLDSWTQIDSTRVIKWGSISQSSSQVNPLQINNSNLTLVLNNADGYFNDESKIESFFYGALTRYHTMVKIEAGYIDTDGTEYPNDSTIYIGLIGETETGDDQLNITFSVEPLENILKQIKAGDSNVITPSASSVWDAYEQLSFGIWPVKAPGDTYARIQTFITNGALRIYGGPQDYTATMVNTDTVGDTNMWDLVRKLGEADRAKTFFTRTGNFFYKEGSLNDLYQDRQVTSGTGDCLAHFIFNSVSASYSSTVGDFTLTATTGDLTTTAMKFGNGVVGTTSANHGYLTGFINGFDPNRWTIECWIKPFADISLGQSSGWTRIIDLFLTDPGNIPNSATVDSFDKIRIGWGTWATVTVTQPGGSASSPYDLMVFKHNHHLNDNKYDSRALSSMCRNNSTTSHSTGTTHFYSFVHDSNGIDGSTDIFRIYHAADGTSSVTNISTGGIQDTLGRGGQYNYNIDYTATSDNERYAYFQIAVPDKTNASHKIGIEDLKIYNYAKLDFPGFNTQTSYTEVEKFEFVGRLDSRPTDYHTTLLPKFKEKFAISKIRNYVKVSYSTGANDYVLRSDGDWTSGGNQSAFLYGERRTEISNEFLQSSAPAAILAQNIYDEYNLPKKEYDASSKFYPYINLLDETKLNYQAGFNNSYKTTTMYSLDFESLAIGASMTANGYTWNQYLANDGAFVVSAGKYGNVYSPTGLFGGTFHYNDATAASWQNYVFSFDIKSYLGGQWTVGFRHNGTDHYAIDHIPGSSLILYAVNDAFPDTVAQLKDWSADDPGTASTARIEIDGFKFSLYIDNALIGTHEEKTYLYSAGSIAISSGDSFGWEVDNILVYSLTSARSFNIDNKKVKIIKAQHNIDKFESKFTLREL